MQRFTAAVANTITVDMIAKLDGSAIIVGVVTVYLVADTGTNAGKWFRASDSSWQAAEASAGTATYKGGCAWQISITASAWTAGVSYSVYGKESGNLNILYTDNLIEHGVETTIEIEETSVS